MTVRIKTRHSALKHAGYCGNVAFFRVRVRPNLKNCIKN